jgi:hypothetical protein
LLAIAEWWSPDFVDNMHENRQLMWCIIAILLRSNLRMLQFVIDLRDVPGYFVVRSGASCESLEIVKTATDRSDSAAERVGLRAQSVAALHSREILSCLCRRHVLSRNDGP